MLSLEYELAQCVWYKVQTSSRLYSSGVLIVVKADFELKVGRRETDGTIRLSPLGHELVQISVGYKGERSSSVVLTRSQVATLRQVLAEYELSLKTSEQEPDVWNRTERRAL